MTKTEQKLLDELNARPWSGVTVCYPDDKRRYSAAEKLISKGLVAMDYKSGNSQAGVRRNKAGRWVNRPGYTVHWVEMVITLPGGRQNV